MIHFAWENAHFAWENAIISVDHTARETQSSGRLERRLVRSCVCRSRWIFPVLSECINKTVLAILLTTGSQGH